MVVTLLKARDGNLPCIYRFLVYRLTLKLNHPQKIIQGLRALKLMQLGDHVQKERTRVSEVRAGGKPKEARGLLLHAFTAEWMKLEYLSLYI